MRAASAGPGTIERLGQVSCPSGILLILDGGLAWMWSHDRQPLLPDWSEISSTANSSVDVALRGPDALVAGLTFDRSNHPLFLYDQPRDGLGQIEDAFSSLLRERGLAARLEPLPERVPHRKRVELSLEHGRGRGVVERKIQPPELVRFSGDFRCVQFVRDGSGVTSPEDEVCTTI